MKKLLINYDVSEYIEKLLLEMNMSKRELYIARKLCCEKQTICKVCRKAKIAEVKFLAAREEFNAMLKTAVPSMTKWNLDFKTQEVTYETN